MPRTYERHLSVPPSPLGFWNLGITHMWDSLCVCVCLYCHSPASFTFFAKERRTQTGSGLFAEGIGTGGEARVREGIGAMDALDALVAQVQGFSGNEQDLVHLSSLLKQADELLATHAPRLTYALAALNLFKHSLGYLYFLWVYFANFPVSLWPDLWLWRIRVYWIDCRVCFCNLSEWEWSSGVISC